MAESDLTWGASSSSSSNSSTSSLGSSIKPRCIFFNDLNFEAKIGHFLVGEGLVSAIVANQKRLPSGDLLRSASVNIFTMLIRNILTLFGLLILASFLGDVLAILIGIIIAFSVGFVFTSLIFLFLALGDKFARGFVQANTFGGVRYPNFSVAIFFPNLWAFSYVIVVTFFILIRHVPIISVTLPLGQLLTFLFVFG